VAREKPLVARRVAASESSSPKDSAKASVRGTSKTAKQLGVYYASDDEIVAWAMQVPAKTWFELSHWARENDKLQPWQRSLLYDVGCRVARDVPVSVKQARQAKKAYDLATEAGFKPSDES